MINSGDLYASDLDEFWDDQKEERESLSDGEFTTRSRLRNTADGIRGISLIETRTLLHNYTLRLGLCPFSSP
mgnify:CR=1 FL=1